MNTNFGDKFVTKFSDKFFASTYVVTNTYDIASTYYVESTYNIASTYDVASTYNVASAYVVTSTSNIASTYYVASTYDILSPDYKSYDEALDKTKLERLDKRRMFLSLNFAKKATNHPEHSKWFSKHDLNANVQTRALKPQYKPVQCPGKNQ